MTRAVLTPGATIGVLGGGQLGRMMALVARQMGYRIVVLDPSPRCPTAQVADGFVVGALDDLDAARHLARQVDVITLDTEHVPADLLAELETLVPVRPGAAVLRTIQDRLVQKQFLDRIGLPQAAWAPVGDLEELTAAIGADEPGRGGHAVARIGRPAILKIRRAGYDGKGQVRIDAEPDRAGPETPQAADRARSQDDPAAQLARLRGQPAVLEEVVRFEREISVILARGQGGAHRIYPIAENVHRRHVLHTTRAPAPMPEAQRRRAEEMAVTVADALGHVGVMAVEMFELADGRLLVNEIAPRTHNSGHYTYGACATSQFEQHVRAICGLVLGDPRPLSGAVMVNLIGDLWADGPPRWQHVLAHPGARLHLYGKDAPAPGRKMGHVVLLDDDTDRALADADALIAALTTST
ncbi:MAG TPA: 5-(carboxyamino)imidazole ribonucleotide synthase [Kofleriaceae bacterium]|nr:5-(carboxyamino)imidazole ribonucleotide synthase [Kofleriaceae bacterium]